MTTMHTYPSATNLWRGDDVFHTLDLPHLPSTTGPTTSQPQNIISTNNHPNETLALSNEDVDLDTAFLPELYGLTHGLEDLEASLFAFADDRTLDVPVLNVLKAGSNLAVLLGFQDTIWDLSALQTLTKSSIFDQLTPNLEPTPAQQTIPHHPIFDVLPWPSMRTKLITIFSLPPQARPLVARSPMALMQLFYDLDDPAEGLRVSGFDWRSEANWEVGQKVFENWWFVLDQDILRRSNCLRERRGARKLLPPIQQNGVYDITNI